MNAIKRTAWLLCLCLLLFSACSEPAAQRAKSEPIESAVAQGRYLEEEVELPAFANVVTADEVAEDCYYLMTSPGEGEGPYEVWRSTDGGYGWEPRSYAWLPELEDYYVYGAAFTAEGGVYLTYADTAGAEEFEDILYYAAYGDESGLRQIEGFPELLEFSSGLHLTGDGRLVVDRGFGVHVVDLDTGTARRVELKEGQLFGPNYLVYDSTLAVGTGSGLSLLDLDGDDGEKISFSASMSDYYWAIAREPDRSAYYYGDRGGLYRVTADGGLTEQVIDGSLAYFGMPSVSILRLFVCSDGTFLTLIAESGGETRLLRYVYHPEVSRLPARELRLYSLRESSYIAQTIGLYQISNPDVMVSYEVGLTEEDGVTVSDALRTLSTELLAGMGPDLLLLDGLPVESYIRHGVLADLSSLVEEDREAFLPHVLPLYQRESALYGIPARVSVPVIAGDDIGELGSLRDLVAWLERQEEQRIGVTKEEVMERFYDICAPRWFPQGEALDADALRDDLIQLEQLVELSSRHKHNEPVYSLLQQAMRWNGNAFAAMVGFLDRMEDAAYLFSATDNRPAPAVKLFPMDEGGIYIPRSIVGVNAAGKQTELARDYAAFVLSPAAQANCFSDGLPVRLDALDQAARRYQPGTGRSGYSSGNNLTGEHYNLNVVWPREDQMDQILELVEQASTPSHTSEVIRQLVLDETAPFFLGKRPLDDTVRELTQKMERYLQEQE